MGIMGECCTDARKHCSDRLVDGTEAFVKVTYRASFRRVGASNVVGKHFPAYYPPEGHHADGKEMHYLYGSKGFGTVLQRCNQERCNQERWQTHAMQSLRFRPNIQIPQGQPRSSPGTGQSKRQGSEQNTEVSRPVFATGVQHKP